MGFFEDLGDGFVHVVTAGQCDGDGCGGDHRATDWGDTLVNSATFGQCDGAGCRQGHTSTWTPVAVTTNTAKDVLNYVLPQPKPAPQPKPTLQPNPTFQPQSYQAPIKSLLQAPLLNNNEFLGYIMQALGVFIILELLMKL